MRFINAILIFTFLGLGPAWANFTLVRGAKPLFSSEEVLYMSLGAPFSELFKHRRDYRHAYEVQGRLSYYDNQNQRIDLPVTITVRGATSLFATECAFPKLKLKFSPSSTNNTVFEGLKTVNIGTHCRIEPHHGWTKVGRGTDGKTPFREAVVYKMASAIGLNSFRTRMVKIKYTDWNGHAIDDQPYQAFFLETMGTVLDANNTFEILGQQTAREDYDPKEVGKKVKLEFESLAANRQIDPLNLLTMVYFEAMIQNPDWGFKLDNQDHFTNSSFQNIKVISYNSDFNWYMFPYDFDIACAVTLRPHCGLGHYSPILLNRLDGRGGELVRQLFLKQKPQIYSLIKLIAQEDPKGAEHFNVVLNQFYQNYINHPHQN